MTDPATGTFVHVTYIAATPERVWQALTESEYTRRFWHGLMVESDWRIGSRVTFRQDHDDAIGSTGTVLAADRPRRLSMLDANETTTTIELEPIGDVVRLTLTNSGLDTTNSMFRLVSAAWPFALANLKSLLETRRVLPMPESVVFGYR